MATPKERFDIVVAGGDVVTPQGQLRLDIGIRNERIAALLPADADYETDERVDASGRVVLPGLVDPHTHVRWPLGDGEATKETVESATRAAIVAGTTTIVDFAPVIRGQDVVKALDRRIAEFEREIACDFGLHSILPEATPATLAAVPRLIERGAASFKLYTTFDDRKVDDGSMWLLLREIGRHGGIAAIHAENDDIVHAACCEQLAHHGDSIDTLGRGRPVAAEAESIAMVLALAEAVGAAVYVLHVTCAHGLDLIRQAQARGVLAAAETCTHYLAFDDGVYRNANAWRYVITPPIRTDEDREALWDAVALGPLHGISSDHCAYGRDQKWADRLSPIPFGAPGIEERLPFLLDRGVRAGKLSIERLVECCSTAPARLMGLYPQKGAIAVGADADVVIVDLEAPWRFEDETVASSYSLYAGLEGHGRATTTLLRGQVVANGGEFVGPAQGGRYVPRRVDYAQIRGVLADAASPSISPVG